MGFQRFYGNCFSFRRRFIKLSLFTDIFGFGKLELSEEETFCWKERQTGVSDNLVWLIHQAET